MNSYILILILIIPNKYVRDRICTVLRIRTRIRIRIHRIHMIFGPPGSGSFYHHAKIVKKNLDSYYFVTLYDFLSLKNDVNVPYLQKVSVISRKNCVKKSVFCWHLEGQWRKWQDPDPGSGSISQRHGSADPDPDPPQNVMDPQYWICRYRYLEPVTALLCSLHGPLDAVDVGVALRRLHLWPSQEFYYYYWHQCFVSGSILGQQIRIRIGNLDKDPDPGRSKLSP